MIILDRNKRACEKKFATGIDFVLDGESRISVILFVRVFVCGGDFVSPPQSLPYDSPYLHQCGLTAPSFIVVSWE